MNGMLQRSFDKYRIGAQQQEMNRPSVNLDGIAPIILFLAAGFLIAFVLFMIERTFALPARNSKIVVHVQNQKRRKALKKRWKTLAFSTRAHLNRKVPLNSILYKNQRYK